MLTQGPTKEQGLASRKGAFGAEGIPGAEPGDREDMDGGTWTLGPHEKNIVEKLFSSAIPRQLNFCFVNQLPRRRD